MRFDGSAQQDRLYDVSLDSSDNVYVCGGLEGSADEEFVSNYTAVRKLSGSTGSQMWQRFAFQPDMGTAIPFLTLAVDNGAGIVVAVSSAEGVWVEGQESAGSRDATALVLNSNDGMELGRWQVYNELVKHRRWSNGVRVSPK